ncbi:LPXTG cell wall anchor domain-containing protein [Sporosarcina sp. FSL W7-1349]|uniref:LPXTG cell wall anchor domain-containing protein n=1 Tax=Sporosarcina sp. FSL W7-1349 TaxID=2921561 RepID=UPI0030F728FE
MKNNWMKQVGMLLGAGAIFLWNPAASDANSEILNADVELLDGDAIADVKLENVPLLGDMDLEIPSNSPSQLDEDKGDSRSAVQLEVQDGIVENLKVDVAPASSSGNEQMVEATQSIASVTLDTPVTKEVSAEVATSTKQSGEANATSQKALVEINAEDLPVVGEAHVGVLDNHESNDNGAQTVDQGVVEVDIASPDLLGDTHVGVLDNHASTDESSTTRDDGVIEATLVDTPILREAHIGVLDDHERNEDGARTMDQGVVEVGIASPDLLGDTHVGVLDNHTSTDESSSTHEGSVVEATLAEPPIIGETHIGVLDDPDSNDNGVQTVDQGVVEVEIASPDFLGETHVGVVEATIAEAPILGETHIGVLDEYESNEDGTQTEDQSVVEIDIASSDFLGDTHVGVLDNHTSTDESSSTHDGGVVEATIAEAPILGETHIGVLDDQESNENSAQTVDQGVVEVDIASPNLLGDTHVGVLDNHTSTDESSTTRDVGVVEATLVDAPIIGETHVGVLDGHETEHSDSSSISTGLAQIGLDGPLLEEATIDNLRKHNVTDTEGALGKEGVLMSNLPIPVLGDVQAGVLVREMSAAAPVAPNDKSSNEVTLPADSVNDALSNGGTPPSSGNEGNVDNTTIGATLPTGDEEGMTPSDEVAPPASGNEENAEDASNERTTSLTGIEEGTASANGSNPPMPGNEENGGNAPIKVTPLTTSDGGNVQSGVEIPPASEEGRMPQSQAPNDGITEQVQESDATGTSSMKLGTSGNGTTIEDTDITFAGLASGTGISPASGWAVNNTGSDGDSARTGQMSALGDQLPKTGGFFDSSLLFAIAGLLVSAGVMIRFRTSRAYK